MAFITREDGERFIIPSYRDILASKKNALLKREIIMLSNNYGEYITFQKKNAEQAEVAFSPDPGYLLGENIWHHFKRPVDMIYCEALPNTVDALLVIVQSGSVYLDGSFPADTIVDELVIFKSQPNKFEIFIHGDVPISEQPEEGKFSLDASQIATFTILEEPLFPRLVGVKTFQLQPVELVLKQNNIGTVPLKKLGIIIGSIIGLLFAYLFFSGNKTAVTSASFVFQSSPYEEYQAILTTPDPTAELKGLAAKIDLLYTVPGWKPTAIEYVSGNPGKLKALMISQGSFVKTLLDWAKINNATVEIDMVGMYVTMNTAYIPPRVYTNTISRSKEVIADILDRLRSVLPGNNLSINSIDTKKTFTKIELSIKLPDVPPDMLITLADVLNKLPLSFSKANLTVAQGNISGTLIFNAVGN